MAKKKLVSKLNTATGASHTPPATPKNNSVKSKPNRGRPAAEASKSLHRAINMLIDQGKFTVDTRPSDLFAVWDYDGPITDAVRSTASRLNGRAKEVLRLRQPQLEKTDSSSLQYVDDVDLILLTAEYVKQFDGDTGQARKAIGAAIEYLTRLGLPKETEHLVERGFQALVSVSNAIRDQIKPN